MNNIPPLKGLTVQDRKLWDKSYKDYLLRQGKSEEDIDKYYVAYHFQKKFGDELTNQIVDMDERINYYNNFDKDTKPTDYTPVNPSVKRGMNQGEIYRQLEDTLYQSNEEYRKLKDANFRLSNVQQNKLNRYYKDLKAQAEEEYNRMYQPSSEPIKLNPFDNGEVLIGFPEQTNAFKYKEAERVFRMVGEEKQKQQKAEAAKDREARMSTWKQEYIDANYDKVAIQPGFVMGGSPGATAISRSNEVKLLHQEADKYAEDMEFHYQLDNTIVPENKNEYLNINNKEDLRNRISELSSIYYEFRNSDWLHNGETKIDWNKLYGLVASDLKDGHIDRAKYNIDQYLSNEVIGNNQELFSADNMGHHGKINSAVRQGTAGAVQSFTEAATFIPSFAIGAIQAVINPDELQLMGGMNWWQRTVDNTIHNDWLLGLSNTSLADWADELQENADIYGTGIGNMLLKGAYTYGAMAGTLADAFATRGTGTLFRSLGKKGIKSVERAAKRQIIGQGLRAKESVLYDKAISATMQLKANYSEAVQQAVETERTIYKNANEAKNQVINNIVEDELSKRLDVNNIPYTEEDLNYVLSQRTSEIQQYWQDIADGKAAVPPEGYDALADHSRMILEAKAKHIFDQRVPGYDDQVAITAHIEAGTETQLATGLLLLGDIAFGGVDKALINFAMGKKALSFSNLGRRIDAAGGFGKWATSKNVWKGVGFAGLNQAKIAATEIATETGQQSISALGQQFGDFTAEQFLMNHLYGDGSAIVGDVSYRYLSELDPERFERDAALGETVKQTLITTLLMPNIGYSGKVKPTQRRQGQSWLGNTVQQLHYYSPVNTQLGNSVFNELAQYGQADAFAQAINKYYNDPKNRAATNGTTAAVNYAIQMMADVANNDQVNFENHQTSKSIAEGIALSMIEGNDVVDTHRQAIKNMAEIKSASKEQQQKAIEEFRRESTMNPSITNMTDEEILNNIEEAGKRVNHIYDRVFEEQAKLDERYGKDRSDWQRRSALIFDVIAKEELEKRIEDKQKFINNFNNSIIEEDLGQSSSDVEQIRKQGIRKNNSKSILLSGQDILKLTSDEIEFMLNPKNKDNFSDEQNTILDKLRDVILEKDPEGKLMDNVQRLTAEKIQYQRLRKEYREILKNENWVAKKVEKQAKETVEEFSPNKKAKKFQKSAINTKSVRELRALYNQEKTANEEKSPKRSYDVEQALRDITDVDTQKKITELDNIERAKNSLQNLISQSNLADELKDSLYTQVEDIAANAENANSVYDISNYSLMVNPENYDTIAGQLQDIINKAKNLATTAQSVNTNPVTEQKGATQNPAPANLGPNRDVDTAPAVNIQPITKLSVEEAKSKILKANDIINKPTENGFDNVQDANNAANKLIEEVKTRCPEGYKVIVGGNGVALISVQPSTTVRGTFDVETGKPKEDKTTPTFVESENVVETEIPYEDIVPVDTSLDAYPDTDVRSVTRVALGKFSPNGKTFAFPIRDEQVDENTQVRTSYTTKERDDDGKEVDVTYTDNKAITKIVSVEEYNTIVAKNPTDYMSLEDIVKNYPRPIFVNQENKEVPKAETPIQEAPTSNIIYEDSRVINTVETSEKDRVTTYKVKSYRKDKQKYTTRGITPISEDLLTDESKEQLNQLDSGDVRMIDVFAEEIRESGDTIVCETVIKVYHYDGSVETINKTYKLKQNPLKSNQTQQETIRTNRTETQQQRLDNNITPARNEISAQFLPKEKEGYKATEQGKEYTRLGDETHRNIDSQLEEQGAFEYRNSGRLQVGDEIQFIVSEEEMPDGTKQPVIWEVTKPKDKQIPEDSKFKGMQVLSVLDQTNITGDRLALIERIRKAYDEAGRPESFLYDKESFKISNIVNGVIPFVQTNPTEAKEQATIESTNLKKGLIKSNGKWGMSFWNQKLGRMIHFPVTFKQVVRNSNGSINEIISDDRVTNIEDIKHEYASQSNTREVMLVTITPTGYKTAHSVYVMRRDIENAVDKYVQAIREGELGKALIKRMLPRLTDNNAVTFFNDFFRFNGGISERVYFDRTHNRLELGYFNNGQYTTLLYAKGIGNNKYVITEQDARNIVNDNNGKGFSFDEIAKEYLTALVQDETVGASVQINMEAITKDHSVVDTLIEDGFLWAPNSINARFGMENTGFNAPINQNTQIESKEETKQETKSELKTAPVEKTPTPVTTPSMQPKQQVPKTIKKDHAMRVQRKKLTSKDTLDIQTPNPVTTQEVSPVNAENTISATLDYNSLTSEQKQHITEKGFTQETFNKLTQLEKENVLNC